MSANLALALLPQTASSLNRLLFLFAPSRLLFLNNVSHYGQPRVGQRSSMAPRFSREQDCRSVHRPFPLLSELTLTLASSPCRSTRNSYSAGAHGKAQGYLRSIRSATNAALAHPRRPQREEGTSELTSPLSPPFPFSSRPFARCSSRRPPISFRTIS